MQHFCDNTEPMTEDMSHQYADTDETVRKKPCLLIKMSRVIYNLRDITKINISMKRFSIFIFLMFVISSTSIMSAQNLKYDYDNFKKNRIAVDLGVGTSRGVGIWDLGLRYQRNWKPYIGWDAASVKATWPITSTTYDSPFIQFMTGLRGHSPKFHKNMSVYMGLSAGYGFHVCSEEIEYGPCVEFGFGLNFTKNIYMGYALKVQRLSYNDYKWGTNLLRLGFEF